MISKRILDVVLASAGLILAGPILLFIAVLIRVDSSGPALFRQERVGRRGKLFRIHKFRTMVPDSRLTGVLLTRTGDPRVTKVGSFLRKYKLDELPQLIDVIRGDMSLVGPRPEVPKYVALYPGKLKEIVLSQRPGITDLAAVTYKDESDILAKSTDPERDYVEVILPEKLKLYQKYIEERTLWGDIVIIFRTLKAIVA